MFRTDNLADASPERLKQVIAEMEYKLDAAAKEIAALRSMEAEYAWRDREALALEIDRLEAQHEQSIRQDNEMLEAIGADPLGTWDDAIETVRRIRGRENTLDVRVQELESRLDSIASAVRDWKTGMVNSVESMAAVMRVVENHEHIEPEYVECPHCYAKTPVGLLHMCRD